MASRLERCNWCGMQQWLPLAAQTLYCPACRAHTTLYNQYSGGYVVPAAPMPGARYPAAAYGCYPRPPPPQPPVYGRKRAVLCGVSYRDHDKPLKGSASDVNKMRYFLVQRMGFPSECVLVLSEDEKDPSRIPTKRNMRAAMRWLLQGSQSGDSLVFHYSGHGSNVRDTNGDEVDGYDEALCPLDFETEGKMLDDEINDILVKPLTYGANLHAIIDTCKSGTCLDLPFVCRLDRNGYLRWRDERTHMTYKGTSGGLAICISACDDNQSSGEITAFTGSSGGVLTHTFIKTMESEARLTYGGLINSLYRKIHEAKKMCTNPYSRPPPPQEPILSSSETFDVYSKTFTL